MIRTAFIIPLLLLGCREHLDGSQGTSVGNPGKGTARIGSGSGLSITSAIASPIDITVQSCDDVPVEGTLVSTDALDLASPATFDIPAGTWCRLLLNVPNMTVTGTGDSGGTVDLDLALEPFWLYTAGLDVEQQTSWAIELGSPGWLDATEIGLPDNVVIDALDPLHDTFEERIYKESALYLDDGDGVLTSAEREQPVGKASDENWKDDVDLDGKDENKPVCSATGSGAAPWIAFLPLLIGCRRTMRSRIA